MAKHHHHEHDRATTVGRLAATLAVTASIMVAELIGGWLSGSLALLADAGHMLTDVLALLIAFAAVVLASRPADDKRTYGYRRLEILAALVNGIALVIVSGSIVVEGLERWASPQPIDSRLMSIVAGIGLLANLLGLWLLGGHRQNLNVKGAFLHILGDTLSSFAVLAGAVVIALTGWTQIDPALSILIAVIIIITSFSLLREVIEVLLEAAPRGLNTDEIRQTMIEVPGVGAVYDLHVWSITSGLVALSAHVVVNEAHPNRDKVLVALQRVLHDAYDIEHATLQLEREAHHDCYCNGGTEESCC